MQCNAAKGRLFPSCFQCALCMRFSVLGISFVRLPPSIPAPHHPFEPAPRVFFLLGRCTCPKGACWSFQTACSFVRWAPSSSTSQAACTVSTAGDGCFPSLPNLWLLCVLFASALTVDDKQTYPCLGVLSFDVPPPSLPCPTLYPTPPPLPGPTLVCTFAHAHLCFFRPQL